MYNVMFVVVFSEVTMSGGRYHIYSVSGHMFLSKLGVIVATSALIPLIISDKVVAIGDMHTVSLMYHKRKTWED